VKKKFLFAILIVIFTVNNFTFAYLNVIDLGTLGGNTSSAGSVNNNGQIAGYAKNSSGKYLACLFDSTGNGANIDLGTLGELGSEALSINNHGQIVGWARNYPFRDRACACFFDPTGGGANVDLGTIAGYANSEARSINDNGQIVGSCFTTGSSPSSIIYRACLFDSTGNGANIDLGTLGGNSSKAICINNSNQIAGYARTDSGYEHACLFDPTGNGANIDLGTLTGNYSAAYAINNKGRIIGDADYQPCLFDPTGQGNNINLSSLIDPASGWTLLMVNGINDNDWVVGIGAHNGQLHGVLFVIPEPMTIALLTLGGLAVISKRKTKI
jgi:probable HAF family extracellular repeat protein